MKEWPWIYCTERDPSVEEIRKRNLFLCSDGYNTFVRSYSYRLHGFVMELRGRESKDRSILAWMPMPSPCAFPPKEGEVPVGAQATVTNTQAPQKIEPEKQEEPVKKSTLRLTEPQMQSIQQGTVSAALAAQRAEQGTVKRDEVDERLKAEQEAAARRAEEERIRAEQEAARKAAEEERLKAEQEAARRVEEERMRAAKEAARRAEEERLKAEQEAARRAEEERIRAEQEAARRAEEERIRAEQERRRAEQEAARRAEEERIRAEQEEEARRLEEERRKAVAERVASQPAPTQQDRIAPRVSQMTPEERIAAAEAAQRAAQQAAREAAHVALEQQNEAMQSMEVTQETQPARVMSIAEQRLAAMQAAHPEQVQEEREEVPDMEEESKKKGFGFMLRK